MKNTINYYYNLIPNDIIKKDDNFIFKIDNIEYELSVFYDDIEELFKIYSQMNVNKIYCHEMIKNNFNSMITVYNGKPYILVKKHINVKQKLQEIDLVNFIVPLLTKSELKWKKLWEQKIDYYEYQMSELANQCALLKESFNYYIGMCETAIQLLNYVEYEDIYYSISHKKINFNDKFSDYCNPLNFIFDSRVRDVAEYIKMKYFYTDLNDISIEEIFDKFINILNLNGNEIMLLIIRLLYPSYYFDLYDGIIQGIVKEENLKKIIKKSSSFELFVKKQYIKYQKLYKFVNVEWFNPTG